MSQTDLADALGITFQQIQKYEKGTNRISSSRLHQIASVFGVPTTYFFENPLTETIHHDVNVAGFDQFCASRDGVALMRAFVKIKGKEVRHSIAKMVEEIVE
jgi:transcriptional regulator with XRE-family HTH domain